MDYINKLIEALRTKMGQNVGYDVGNQASGIRGSADDYRNYLATAASTGEPVMSKEQWLATMAGGGQ